MQYITASIGLCSPYFRKPSSYFIQERVVSEYSIIEFCEYIYGTAFFSDSCYRRIKSACSIILTEYLLRQSQEKFTQLSPDFFMCGGRGFILGRCLLSSLRLISLTRKIEHYKTLYTTLLKLFGLLKLCN